ncbi:MAG: 16S rRNA (guanine(527)-N(7))-methyltransferase RsmG [Candidatus Rokubacteria bacterium]|nr:16S rRNA (guanine(527)-N(7))-methyltransferase RsmG [Candidatus Rokubacteria bacterium]
MTAFSTGLVGVRLPGVGRELTALEADNIDKYLNLLTKWQGSHRLVGSVEPGWLLQNVVVDSLAFLEAVPPTARRIADIGSGAGLPGVPIAIMRRDLELVLIEPRRRRASFLSATIRELDLTHVSLIESRVEELRVPATFDAAMMRCAGDVVGLIPVVFPLLRSGGALIASGMPGRQRSEAPTRGLFPAEIVTVRLPGGSLRHLRRWVKADDQK